MRMLWHTQRRRLLISLSLYTINFILDSFDNFEPPDLLPSPNLVDTEVIGAFEIERGDLVGMTGQLTEAAVTFHITIVIDPLLD